MKRLSLVCVLAVALTAAISGVARADTTLGSISLPAGAVPGTCNGAVVAETQSDPSTPFTVPSSGTITSWRVAGVAAPDSPITLVVLRSTGGMNYSVVGADTHNTPNPVPDVISFTIASPIAVSGGEILALYAPGTGFACYVHGGTTPSTDALISLLTGSTPVAGQALVQDDFSGGGYRLNLEATLTPPTPTPPAKKKKCKKKKKHKRSAESAKKKCKKKKKR
jgi:hypothetical protein